MASSIVKIGIILIISLLYTEISEGWPTNSTYPETKKVLTAISMKTFNRYSPTKNSYSDGELVAGKLINQPPYSVYRLEFALTPDCQEEPCEIREERCRLDIKRHEEIDELIVLVRSIKCKDPNKSPSRNYLPGADIDLRLREVLDSLDNRRISMISNIDEDLDTEPVENPGYIWYGNSKVLDSNRPDVIYFADKFVEVIESFGYTSNKLRRQNILRASRVVSPGADSARYYIIEKIGITVCDKESQTPISECDFQPNKPIVTCAGTFDKFPWTEPEIYIPQSMMNCTEPSLFGDSSGSDNNTNKPEIPMLL